MRVGVLVPTRGAVMQSARRPPVAECWAMARHADEAGYDAVWEPALGRTGVGGVRHGPQAARAPPGRARYAEAGVTDLCVRFVGDDQQAQLERFTKEVLEDML